MRLRCLALGVLGSLPPVAALGQSVPPLRPVSEYWDYMADWSPDGAQIAFSSTRATHPARSLFVVDVTTGTVAPLTHNADQVRPGDSHPRWSPDGTRIAFTSNREGNGEVYVVNPDGSGLRNLTNNPSHEEGKVDWSPDGQRLVFVSDRDGDSDLYTMNADGSDVRRLTDLLGNVTGPAWSPDGSRIAFAWDRDVNWELYTIAADGGDLQRLTYHWAWDGHPTWSPDGARLAFWSDRDEFWFEIYVMDADGANVRRLTHSPDWDLDPAWSPDGEQIAWHSAAGRYGIEVINVDGTGRRRLTSAEPSDFARVVRREGVDAALEAYRQAKQRQPSASFLYDGEIWLLADELLAKGDTAGAIRLHEFHLDVASGPAYYAYEGLGRAYRAAGQPAPPGFAEFFRLIRSRGVTHARTVFDQTRQDFPGWQLFSQFRMNRLGYEYLNRGWVAAAIELFEMNVAAYPESPNVYDSLAEARLRAGDRQGAIAMYEKALAMDPNGPVGTNATRVLQRLRLAETGGPR